MSIEYRTFIPDLEVREARGGRLLCGIVIPYGINKRIDESLTERFERGAFNHQLRAAHRIPLMHLHRNSPGSLQLGKVSELRDDAAGLYGELKVVESRDGDHYLALVREDALREWSIGFYPDASRFDGRITVRTKATLFEVALVPEGAYGELATVGEVRAAIPKLTRDTLLARLPQPRFPA